MFRRIAQVCLPPLRKLEAKKNKLEALLASECRMRQDLRQIRLALSPRDTRYIRESEMRTARLVAELASVNAKIALKKGETSEPLKTAA